MRKLFITGGSSYLGQAMVPFVVQQGWDVCYTYNSTMPQDPFPGRGVQVDVRDGSRLMKLVSEYQPDAIIHLAASNRSSSEEVMVSSIEEGANNIVLNAARFQIPLIHMSTDVVFDGTEAPYNEESPVSPPHAYGWAKANAEKSVLEYGKTKVVRPSLIYGLSQKDRSTEWIEKSIEKGEGVTLFTNQIRMPVWVDTLSAACLELIDLDFHGIVHVVGRQVMSRAEFGTKLLEWWGIDPNGLVKLEPAPDDAPWPADLRMEIELAGKILKTPLLGIDEVFTQLS